MISGEADFAECKKRKTNATVEREATDAKCKPEATAAKAEPSSSADTIDYVGASSAMSQRSASESDICSEQDSLTSTDESWWLHAHRKCQKCKHKCFASKTFPPR